MVASCWEVVLDVALEGQQPVVNCWDGSVGMWRGSDAADLVMPQVARTVHVTRKIGTVPQHCAGLRLPDEVRLVDLSGLQLTSLGHGAFRRCSNLTSIEAPGGCSLGEVGSCFAADTQQLRYIDLCRMRMTSVKINFLSQSGIERLDLSGLQLTSIGRGAFYRCPNLTSIEAPGGCSLGKVGSDFCCMTPRLRHIDLSRMRMTSVEIYFLSLSGIERVDLSGLQLTSLGHSAFFRCSNLTSIEAPGGCSLGEVGARFAADTPRLRRVDVSRMGITSVGERFVDLSGIAST